MCLCSLRHRGCAHVRFLLFLDCTRVAPERTSTAHHCTCKTRRQIRNGKAVGAIAQDSGTTQTAFEPDYFMNFEPLDHPADVGFRACGNTLEEVFENCAHAL